MVVSAIFSERPWSSDTFLRRPPLLKYKLNLLRKILEEPSYIKDVIRPSQQYWCILKRSKEWCLQCIQLVPSGLSQTHKWTKTSGLLLIVCQLNCIHPVLVFILFIYCFPLNQGAELARLQITSRLAMPVRQGIYFLRCMKRYFTWLSSMKQRFSKNQFWFMFPEWLGNLSLSFPIVNPYNWLLFFHRRMDLRLYAKSCIGLLSEQIYTSRELGNGSTKSHTGKEMLRARC